jgi:hypothetical protein
MTGQRAVCFESQIQVTIVTVLSADAA